MAFCRWKYENLYNHKFINIKIIPKSLWCLYMPYQIQLKSLKGANFLKVFGKLLNLGLYDFAKWVFVEIANECSEEECYFISSTFQILNQDTETNIFTQTFAMDKTVNATELVKI